MPTVVVVRATVIFGLICLQTTQSRTLPGTLGGVGGASLIVAGWQASIDIRHDASVSSIGQVAYTQFYADAIYSIQKRMVID
jgi:hypothetical protein